MKINIIKKIYSLPQNLIKRIFTIYVASVFFGSFLLLCPLMYFFVLFKSMRSVNHWLYRIWGYIVLLFWGVYRIPKYRFKKKKNTPYIYCANHTSYVDIPVLYTAIHENLHFIGKSSLKKLPLFGYLYDKMHLLVNRRSSESKKEVLERSREALKNGISLVIFPEGTIPKVGKRPDLIEFKEGAFRLAVETKTPIVPVVIENNYRILPDDGLWQPAVFPAQVTFYEPIETYTLTLEDVAWLKNQVFQCIQHHIIQHTEKINNKI